MARAQASTSSTEIGLTSSGPDDATLAMTSAAALDHLKRPATENQAKS
jgi:hypothetical protein